MALAGDYVKQVERVMLRAARFEHVILPFEAGDLSREASGAPRTRSG
jgi:hypothetical protein